MTIEQVRSAADIVQWLVLSVSVATLALALYTGHRWTHARPYLLPVITLAGHSIVFYLLVLNDLLPSPYGNLWSAVLRLHSYVVIFGMLAIFVLGAWNPAAVHRDDGNGNVGFPEYYTPAGGPEEAEGEKEKIERLKRDEETVGDG